MGNFLYPNNLHKMTIMFILWFAPEYEDMALSG